MLVRAVVCERVERGQKREGGCPPPSSLVISRVWWYRSAKRGAVIDWVCRACRLLCQAAEKLRTIHASFVCLEGGTARRYDVERTSNYD
jgi:hypothetical protein